MTLLLVSLAVALAVLGGAFLLASYLWYRYGLRVHAGRVLPDDAVGARLLRYGVAAGFATFGGFLLVFVLHLLAETTTANQGGSMTDAPLAGLPFEEVAIGLFLLSLSAFLVAAGGYVTDALRSDGVR